MIADSFIVYRIVLHKCCNKYNNSTNKQKKNKEKVQVSVVFPSFLFGNSSSSYELLEKKHDILNLSFLFSFSSFLKIILPYTTRINNFSNNQT